MEKLLTPKEVSDSLGISLGTLYVWTHSRKIPYLKVGHLLRFRQRDLEEWMAPKHKTPGEGEAKAERNGKARCTVKNRQSSFVDSIVKNAKTDVLK